MVKCMEELFLCTFFSYNELDIINQKYIIITVFIAEFRHCGLVSGGFTVLQSFDQLICKCLTGYIEYFFLWILVQNKMRDRVHQMGLSKSNTSI